MSLVRPGLRVTLVAVVLLFLSEPSRAQEWEYLGLPGSRYISGIALQNEDTIFVSTPRVFPSTPGFIFRTTNAGSQWDTVLQSPSVADLRMHPRDPEILYAGLGSFDPPYGIMKTTDFGQTWFNADSGINVDGEHFVGVIVFDPVHPETLFAGTSGPFGGDLYKTTNGGENWIPSGFSDLGSGVLCIAIDPVSSNVIYAGTSYTGLFLSTDGGTSWERILSVTVAVNAIGIDPMDTGILYVGLSDPNSSIVRSTDGGTTWTQSNTGVPANTSAGRIVVSQETREVFVVVFPDSVGLFKSVDLGLSWARMDGLVSGTWVTDQVLSPDHLYVALDSQGVYRTPVFVTDVSHDQVPSPAKTILLGNYPNPFNSSTLIQFESSGPDEVHFVIYDLLGRPVATLANGGMGPGRHEILFNGEGLPTGVYLCRLSTSSGGSEIIRLLLIR